MPRTLSRSEIARSDIVSLFDSLAKRVFSRAELAQVLHEHREFWRLTQKMTTNAFTEFLTKRTYLKIVKFESEHYTSLTRFVWRDVTPHQLALGIRASGYLSHGTAVFLHGLNDQLPWTIYVNDEQSPKPKPSSALSQDRLDIAFSNQQRQSNLIYTYGTHRFVVLRGKNTGNLEVQLVTAPSGESLPTTTVERTLIDIVVRPGYAGGIQQVLHAYRNALQRV